MKYLAASLAFATFFSPPAAFAQLDTTVPAPADTTPPIISAVVSTSVSSIAETVTWITDELAVSTFEYGPTQSYGSAATLSASLAIGGTAELTNLSPSTTYYYCIHATDAANNASKSCGSFTTAAAPQVQTPTVEATTSPSGAEVSVTDTTPPAIADITAASANPSTAVIAWATNELAVSTLEYGTTTSYGSAATLPASALLAHAAELTGLAAGTTYHYCIHATDLAGNAAQSCGHSFTTAASAVVIDTMPPAVSAIAVSSLTTSGASISWTTSELAAGFVEYGATSAYGSQTPLQSDLALNHSAQITGLSTGTTYHYRIHATDAAGNAFVTPDETFTTEAASVSVSAPATPSPDVTAPSIENVMAIPGTSIATITWDTNELAVSTLEYGTTGAYGSSATLSASALLAHSATLTGLSGNTTYYYCIRATDAAGNRADSCTHSFTTIQSATPVDTTPPLILFVTNSSLTASSATIAWSANEPAEAVVEYGTTAAYGSSSARTSPYDLTGAVELSGLSPSTTYHYRVRVFDAAGNTAVGQDFTLTTPAANTSQSASGIPASEALAFSAIGASTMATTTATISWETNLPSNSLVEYGSNYAFDHTASDGALVTAHAIALANLAPGTVYQYRVVSAAAGGVPMISGMHEFTTLAEPVVIDPPAHIVSVSASQVSASGATISFATSEATVGAVEYGTTTAYGTRADGNSSASATHTVALSGLASGTMYHYRVDATDSSGNLTYSIDHTFTTTGASAASGQNVPSGGNGSSATATSASSGGPAGGGAASAPALVAATAADGQMVFIWNTPSAEGAGTLVVRKSGGYPTSRSDGEAVYRGDGATYTDTGLTNDSTYYYALYSYNAAGNYSTPIRVAGKPQAGIEEVQISRVPALVPALAATHFPADLTLGDRNLEVGHLQQILAVAGMHPADLTTGYFGTRTKASLTKFQAAYGLAQTGIADEKTRSTLDAFSSGWVSLSAPSAIGFVAADLSRGATGEAVAHLQEFLAHQGSYPEALITGYYGSLTQAAVARFQRAYGITPAVGYLGPKTRHTIQSVLGK